MKTCAIGLAAGIEAVAIGTAGAGTGGTGTAGVVADGFGEDRNHDSGGQFLAR